MDLIGSFGEMISANPVSYNQRNFAVTSRRRLANNFEPIVFQTRFKDSHVTIETSIEPSERPLPSDKDFMAKLELPGTLFKEIMKTDKKVIIDDLVVVAVGYRSNKLFTRINHSGNIHF